jgi:hypothetical protein
MNKPFPGRPAIARRYRAQSTPVFGDLYRHRTCRSRLIERLAELMREMAFAGENVTTEALAQRLDCAPSLIGPLARAAIDLARRRSIRRLVESQEPRT